MRDHGAAAIVPLNRCMMIGCVLFSLILLPWWCTLAVAVLVAALWRVTSDPYGGMQLCLLLLPGMFLGLAAIGRTLEQAEADGRVVELGEFLAVAVFPVVFFVLSMLVVMAVNHPKRQTPCRYGRSILMVVLLIKAMPPCRGPGYPFIFKTADSVLSQLFIVLQKCKTPAKVVPPRAFRC